MFPSPHILIIDPHPKSKTDFKPFLEGLVVSVLNIHTPQDAYPLIEEQDFALIIMVSSPGESHMLELCKQISLRKTPHFSPIVVCFRSPPGEELLLQIYDAGAIDDVIFPISPDIFKTKIQVYLELYRQRQIIEYQRDEQAEIIREKEDLNRLLKEANQALQEKTKALELLASQDGLTGLANRRIFDDFLYREWQRCRREELPLSLIFIDIDYFKLYNDTYGHPAGDHCLIEVARLLKKMARRTTDLAARYGGEEFALILSNTSAADAQKLAGVFQNKVNELNLPHVASAISDRVTVSMGVVTCIPASEQWESFLDQADEAMYQAKRQGRNQWVALSGESVRV